MVEPQYDCEDMHRYYEMQELRDLRKQRDELLAVLKDASRTLQRCISACAEKRTIGVQSPPCLVCRLEAAISKAESR
jgi:hypothetical protein